MPVDFLSTTQKARYGCYIGEPSETDMARCFYLDDADTALIVRRRNDDTQLGFALQLTTVRYLGTFLTDPTDVPAGVVAQLAQQLGFGTVPNMEGYRTATVRWQHSAEISRHSGYQSYGRRPLHLPFLRWLYARAWMQTERPSILFERAIGWLLERKVLLPGVTVLERDVAEVYDRANVRVWRVLTRAVPPDAHTRLNALVVVAPNERISLLEQLRHPPVAPSSVGLLAACDRLQAVRALGVGSLTLPVIPVRRLHTLGRFALAAKAQTLAELRPERRTATLLAGARLLELLAHDTVLDLFDTFFGELRNDAIRAGTNVRVRTLQDLDTAALQLAKVATLILDANITDTDLRTEIHAQISQDMLAQAITQVEALARPAADTLYDELKARYPRISRIRPTLLGTISFGALPAGAAIVAAYQFLQQIDGQKRPSMNTAPQAIITRRWRPYVRTTTGDIDRLAYTYCVLDQLTDALRRREVFVTPSIRYADPRLGMLEGKAWEMARPQVCRTFSRSADGRADLEQLTTHLDATYRTVAAALPTNTAVSLETAADGTVDLSVSPLDRLDEPASLTKLRGTVDAMMPQGDLPDVLLEMQQRTGFLDEFTHISEANSRARDLHVSLCAVLVAEACNIGLAPVINPAVPALTRDRLTWVQQNYLRPDTLSRANARLVDAQSQIWLAQQWGGGEVASADGLRFVVPVRTVYAGPNAEYFPKNKRGITLYNLMSNQYTGMNGVVVTGTLRDSLVLIGLLLGQQTTLQPTEIMTDTGAYSDIIFGLLWLLGYQFSPRISAIGGARFWRVDRTADYGALNSLATHTINTTLITTQWDELLRLIGSLTLANVQIDTIVRTLQRGNSRTKLAQALQELGRLIKTRYLLQHIHDGTYRRRILIQLNRGEGRHRLARVVYHGQRGEMRHRYREGQEDQLSALGLVVNAIVLWNTIYMDRALAQLGAEGQMLASADVARLSPLGNDHLNVLGRYSFALPSAIEGGAWRAFRA